jgi:fermentation-respiration switch protein FrsA (DUF1100 family)
MNSKTVSRLVTGATTITGLSATGAILLSPRFMPGLYEREMFQPESGNVSMDAIEHFDTVPKEEVWLPTHGGVTLNGWMFRNPKAVDGKMILYFHGSAGNIAWRLPMIELLLRQNLSVFVYSHRGFGRSTGSPTLAHLRHDALVPYEYLIGLGYGPDQITAFGESMGNYIVAYLVSQGARFQRWIHQAGFYSLERIAKDTFPGLRVFPSFLWPDAETQPYVVLQGVHPPVLFFHGMQDEIVPFAHAQDLFRVTSGQKVFVPLPKTRHAEFGGTDARLFIRALRDFSSGKLDGVQSIGVCKPDLLVKAA